MSSQNETSKKAGPVEIEDTQLGGGEILGVSETKLVLVNLRDGLGKNETKLAMILPDKEIYFLDSKVVGRSAQKWAKHGILKKLGML